MDSFSYTEWGMLLALMITLGGVAGFLAGLLGIGGGIVLVPGLYFVFKYLGFDPDLMMHVAVGTSLAIIIPTGLSSARAHWKKAGVRFDLVRRIGIGIGIGVVIGTLIADRVSGETLKLVFACALVFFAGLMQINPERFRLRDDVPPQPIPLLAGSIIGTLSTLMGIGGATMNVPFMALNGVSMHRAVGTASALGPLIAIPGAIGFILIGWNHSGLPPLSLGFVNLLAAAVIVPVSVTVAPYGARVAHAVSVKSLRRVFSIFMIIIAIKMLYGVLNG